MTKTLKGLQDLGDLRQQMQAEREQAEREAAAVAARRAHEREAAQRAEAERKLFVRAAGPVQPLRVPERVRHAPALPPPEPTQLRLDEKRVLAEAIGEGITPHTLLDTDDALSFRREGIGPDVTQKLRRGEWSIQDEIDLHGLRSEEAREALAEFVRIACRRGMRCVRIVHGKGLGSPGKTPVLKGKVHLWLARKSEVLAFVQARADEGGAGAVVVLLS